MCDSLTRRNGCLVFENPSVINGAQTLYAIHGAARTNKTALVTVRALVRRHHGDIQYDEDEWLQGVIRGVNTQNKVNSLDFFSNEPEQFELQRLFQRKHVFYEREAANGTTSRTIRSSSRSGAIAGDALFHTDRDRGRNRARCPDTKRRFGTDISGPSALWQTLRQEDGAMEVQGFYLAYRLFRFLGEHGYKDAKTWRKQRHGFWNCLWLGHLVLAAAPGIPEQCTVSSIDDGFEIFASRTQVGRHARMVVKQLTAAVWRASAKVARRDRERWTPNNFFKEKYGNQCLKCMVVPAMRKELAALARNLIK